MHPVGQGFVLMQDNYPNSARGTLKAKRNILQLVQLADLNPIEIVWDELNQKVRAKQPTSAAHLWKLL